jgi:hypothetical protein
MGLDNFASRTPGEVSLTEEDELAFTDAGIELCGSMYTDGISSFRGKVYALFVREVTGESLSEEWLPPQTVSEMADKLAACDPYTAAERLDLFKDAVPSVGEIRDLQLFFSICVERGLGLIGWW